MENVTIEMMIRLITNKAKCSVQQAYCCHCNNDKNGEIGYMAALRAQNEILDLMGAKEISHLDYYNNNNLDIIQ